MWYYYEKRTGHIIASVRQIESDSHFNLFSREDIDSRRVSRHIYIQFNTHNATHTHTHTVQLIVLLLSWRSDDNWRPGDGERTPLSALPSSQLFGHSLQRDQTGPNRHEHSFHPAQCWHQDQGNLLACHTLPFLALNCKIVFCSVCVCVFFFFFTISLLLKAREHRVQSK